MVRQIVQSAGGGPVELVEGPTPGLTSAQVLVATSATLISAGTERAVTQLAQSSLVEKARARPDLVKQVIAKAKVDGVKATAAAVRARLSDDVALGYSGAGVVVEVGDGVRGLRPGDRVATGGGGFATHADFQAVPWTLVSKIPDGVSDEQAAFATVASVGLHGLRQAEISVGGKVLIVGLGLIGQLTARMARAAGCDVFGVDLSEDLVEMARTHGVIAAVEQGADTTQAITDWSRGRGADAVILTAGGRGDSSIVKGVPARCRDRAIVVAVGDLGLDLNRNDFYAKELELRLARSYGPGRHERSYEEWGVDLPPGYVRWSEGRNLEAVLDLLKAKTLDVEDLITHRFDIAEAGAAYETLEDPSQRALGIVLGYGASSAVERTVERRSSEQAPGPQQGESFGLVGAGSFSRGVLVPAAQEAGWVGPLHVASASGVSAARLAERAGAARVSSDAAAVWNDPSVDLVAIASPHSLHATHVVSALEAGKHVYCEKPLALTWSELDEVKRSLDRNDGRLYVGFNRRYSPMVTRALAAVPCGAPRHVVYRINAGPLAAGHWYSDHREGGRLLGEICHFVDLCGALASDQSVVSKAIAGPGTVEHDTYHVMLEYQDGSTASILYCADAHVATAKEYVEVHGGGHTAIIDNFRSLRIDGEKIKVAAGKGHSEGLRAFRTESWRVSPGSLATTELMLSLADQLNGRG